MLTLETRIPVSLRTIVGAAPDPDAGAAAQMLRSLNVTALGGRHDGPEHAAPDAMSDIARLEAKLDVVLRLVGALVAERTPLPEARAVAISADGIRLEWDATLPVGARAAVALYLDPALPQALELPVTVTSAQRCDAGGYRVQLAFERLDPVVRDEIERYVFLRHRRELAAQAASTSKS